MALTSRASPAASRRCRMRGAEDGPVARGEHAPRQRLEGGALGEGPGVREQREPDHPADLPCAVKSHRVGPDFGSTLTVSNRDSQSNCWVNWNVMGQPCEFQIPGRPPTPRSLNVIRTGLARIVDHVQGSGKDSQSRHWAKSHDLGQPCEIYFLAHPRSSR
jgi:hypothetical protein